MKKIIILFICFIFVGRYSGKFSLSFRSLTPVLPFDNGIQIVSLYYKGYDLNKEPIFYIEKIKEEYPEVIAIYSDSSNPNIFHVFIKKR